MEIDLPRVQHTVPHGCRWKVQQSPSVETLVEVPGKPLAGVPVRKMRVFLGRRQAMCGSYKRQLANSFRDLLE